MKSYQLFTFFTLVLFSIFCSATPSLEDYGKLPTTPRVAISPNGEFIAYRQTESDHKDMILVYSLKKSKVISAVNVSDIDPGYIHFSNNETLLLSASKYVNRVNYRDGFDVGTIYTFDIKTSKAKPLIKHSESIGGQHTIYSGQSIRNIIGYNSDHSRTFVAAYVERSMKKNSRFSYSLLSIKTEDDRKLKIIQRGNEHVMNYFINNNGVLLAREEHNDITNKHSIKSLVNGKWKTIYQYQAEILTHKFLGLSDDFKSIIYVRDDEDNWIYYKLSLSDGEISLLDNAKIEKDIVGVLINDANIVVGMRYGGLYPSYKLFDPKNNQRIQNIIAMFPGHTVTLSNWTDDWKHIVVKVEGNEFVSDFFLFSEGQPTKIVAKARPSIPKEAVNSTATVTFIARDGLKIPTILTLPKSHMDSLKNLPTVVLPHRGPASLDQVGFDYMSQALASKGYLVVQPQYRGSRGFGHVHLRAGYGEWGKKMQNDLTDSVNFLVRKGYTDPKRVCIAGASYGGYAALAGSALTPDVYQCAFSLAGISDLNRMLIKEKNRKQNNRINPYLARSILNDDYDTNELKEISPYFHVDKVKIPVMLIHGEDDNVVDFSQSKIMYKALKKAGKDVELIKLKDEDHYLREGSTRIQALKAMIGFIDKHIGDRE